MSITSEPVPISSIVFPLDQTLSGGAPGGHSRGGKEGEEDRPGSPPFPPSLRRADDVDAHDAENASPPLSAIEAPHAGEDTTTFEPSIEVEDASWHPEVYTPAPTINPVVVALKDAGLYRSSPSPRVHNIACPWARQHDPDNAGLTAYVEPDELNRQGQFSCTGNHSGRLGIGNLLDALDIDPDRATGKPIIRLVAGEMGSIAEASERVLCLAGEFYQAGTTIVRILNDRVTGDLRTEPLNEASLAKALSVAAIWLKWNAGREAFVRTDPPPRNVSLLHRSQDLKHLPLLKGLARQPYLRSDGEVVTRTGYDPESFTVGAFSPGDFPMPEPTEAAARGALEALMALLSEFPFRAEHDRSAALAAILTAAVRSQLPLAPAFNLSASASGSGKSYLASLISLFAGPAPFMSVSYPVRADEAGKAVMTMLLPRPAVIVFDDMSTDWKAHGIINRMLTSETISDRLLGGNQSATVSTATLIMGTGNNVESERDLRRRVISIYLSPLADSPATLSYIGRPVEQVRNARGRYVAHALTIVRAWIAAGRPMADVFDIASFGAWSDQCRQPLIWLGQPDPATSLIEQVQADPELEALGTLLRAWNSEFANHSAMVRTVIGRAEADPDGDLFQAMLEMPFMDVRGVNRSKFGHYLKKNVNRYADGLQIVRAENTERNAWAVVLAGEKASGYEPNAVPRKSSPYGKLKTPVPDARIKPGVVVDPDEVF